MKRENGRWRRQRGVAVIITAVMLPLVIAMSGLAFDVGLLYVVKTKLNSAVDAAALAAGRSLNMGTDIASAKTAASEYATRFFTANFPAGYMGSTLASAPETNLVQQVDGTGNPNGVLDMSVKVTINAPAYFLRMFNVSAVPIQATGTASRRSLVMMLVLDESYSMGTRNTNSSCDAMVAAARSFINYFTPYDWVGMVSFESTATLDYALSTNFKNGSLATKIQAINCGGSTNTTGGLELAYRQITGKGLKLALNTIVLFTDGLPNGVAADFPIKRQADTRYGPASSSPAPPYGSTCNRDDVQCVNMPAKCTSGTTVRGVLTQSSSMMDHGGLSGLYKSMSTDASPSYPYSCSGLAGNGLRQMLSYIPAADIYGNSTSGFRDGWLYQVNQQCSSDPDQNPRCKNLGDLWSNHPTVGTGSNVFPSSNPYYADKLRTDQPNTVAVASMNTALNEATKIRSNPDYHVQINSIYLITDQADPADRDFLPMVSNLKDIPPSLFEPAGTPSKPNPEYNPAQQQGTYLATTNKGQLQALFSQIASSLLRLSR